MHNAVKTLAKIVVLFSAYALTSAEQIQLRTTDGQSLRGEIVYLTVEDLQFKLPYGTIRIPRSAILNPEALQPYLAARAQPSTRIPLTFDGLLDRKAILNAKIDAQHSGQLTPRENARIAELVGSFKSALAFERPEIVEALRAVTPRANEMVARAYLTESDRPLRIELLRGITVLDNAGAIPIIEATYKPLQVEWLKKVREDPQKGSSVVALNGRKRTEKDVALEAKVLSDGLYILEQYASEIGGAGAAIFLFEIYKDRYSDRKHPLSRWDEDLSLLLRTISPKAMRNIRPQRSAAIDDCRWSTLERALVLELLIPELHHPSEQVVLLSRAVLAGLLPENNPGFKANHAHWAQWWRAARTELLDTPLTDETVHSSQAGSASAATELPERSTDGIPEVMPIPAPNIPQKSLDKNVDPQDFWNKEFE